LSSQIGDDRPVDACALSPDASLLATGAFSGVCRIWSIPDCASIASLRGHRERVSGIAFHPESCKSLSRTVANIATGSADATVRLWSLDGAQIGTLEGHAGRVCRTAYHPSGRFLGSTSFDKTWRLWDLEKQMELLMQEGHYKEAYAIAFHPDGSLVATGGLDSICRVWDLRSGKSILVFEGHVKDILAIDFHTNGFHMATGSFDHTKNLGFT